MGSNSMGHAIDSDMYLLWDPTGHDIGHALGESDKNAFESGNKLRNKHPRFFQEKCSIRALCEESLIHLD